MVNIYKELPRRTNEMVSNRYQVKKFRDSDTMHRFLNKQYDNNWKELTLDTPLKSGIYFQQSNGRTTNWINVKELQF